MNRSTNDLEELSVSWLGGKVSFGTLASPPTSHPPGTYGAPSSDTIIYPLDRMPTKEVRISYLTPGPITNNFVVVLSRDAVQSVRQSHSDFMFVVNADGTITSTISPESALAVTILVPADRQKYEEMIAGEQFRAAAELPFVSKKVVVPYSSDVIGATAEAAARESPDQAGEGVRYLKIHDGTAYVLLPMDCDGWAGVGFARATSHPIVERSLLQFKNIKRVVWDVVPGEKLQDGGPAISK